MTFIWKTQFPNTEYNTLNIQPLSKGYKCSNYNIIQNNGNYDVIIRTVNYSIIDDHNYVLNDIGFSFIHTENILATYDKKWNLLQMSQIIDTTDRIKYPSGIQGLEDLRQCIVDKKKYITASCADSNKYGIPETVLYELLENGELINYQQLKPNFEESNKKQKNWAIFSHNNSLHAVYENNPLTIHKIDINSGNFDIITKISSPNIAKGFRGSTNLIKYKNGYLYIVHEVEYVPKWQYSSRFIVIDENYIMTHMSPKFYFLKEGIEVALSLCYDFDENYVIVGASYRDSNPFKIKILLTDVESILNKVE